MISSLPTSHSPTKSQNPSPQFPYFPTNPKQIQLYIIIPHTQMQQSPKSPPISQHLSYIIQSIHRKTKTKLKQQYSLQSIQSLKKFNDTLINLIQQFDQKINQCKKYNQAKIHRKYQIIISTLQSRISYLQQIIKQLIKSRSPQKKYQEDLIDKLIKNKFEIEHLNKKYTQLSLQNNQNKKILKIYSNNQKINTNYSQNNIPDHQCQSINKFNHGNQQINTIAIKQQIFSYLKLKSQLRRHQKSSKSKFQRYLIKNKQKLQSWNFRQFLQSIDQWISQNFDTIKYDQLLLNQQLTNKSKYKSHSLYNKYGNNFYQQDKNKKNHNAFQFKNPKYGFRSYILK